LWLLACTNAFNLIDGLDGLAAGVGLFATITTLCAALIHGNLELALATAPLAGALIGFLRYNSNPASIFLGDCGSLSIGFLLGCYAVLWSQKSATLLGMTAPIIVLAVPMVDVVLSIIRRFLSQKAIFGADRGHIHHRLLDLGLTPRRAVLIVYCFCACAASVSLVQSTFHNHYSAFFVLLFCIGTCFAIANLGYTEFRVAGQLLLKAAFQPKAYAMSKGTFRDQVKMQVSLINLQVALSREEVDESVDVAC
jgi:UDP-GlcNAc:undecaprenyl-phosphate GlcNAc-1-phosphate transferase